MAEPLTKEAQPQVTYVLRNAKKGEPVFQDVVMPDGRIIRRVDRAVHDRALRRVAERLREPAG